MREKSLNEGYMHALESIVSMDIVTCSTSEIGSSSEIEMVYVGDEGAGWNPQDYLQIHLTLLITMKEKVSRSEKLREFLNRQIEATQKWIELKLEELSGLFINRHHHCDYGREKIQIEKNCIVKNLLAVIEQDALNFYDLQQGIEIYREFYLGLVQSALLRANKYAIPMANVHLPCIEAIAENIRKTQSAFTDIPSAEILHGDIVRLYNTLRNKIEFQPPMQMGTNLYSSFSPTHPYPPDSSSILDEWASASKDNIWLRLPLPLPFVPFG